MPVQGPPYSIEWLDEAKAARDAVRSRNLVVQIGTLRRHVGLPTSMSHLVPAKATLQDRILSIEMKEQT